MQTTTDVANDAPLGAIAVVENFLRLSCTKNLDACLGYLSDDVVYHNPPFPPDRGRAAAERTLRTFMKIPGEFHIEIHNIAERDGVVLTERTDSVRSTYFDVSFWVCGTLQVQNGKIVLWRDHFDVGALALSVLTGPLRRLLRASGNASAR